ncbi:Collagen Alpha-5(Vi) Chain [Manis pentadactyla]|nr:Collagen Alpha-5(Vi) Chain [Manis pentadactyla]
MRTGRCPPLPRFSLLPAFSAPSPPRRPCLRGCCRVLLPPRLTSACRCLWGGPPHAPSLGGLSGRAGCCVREPRVTAVWARTPLTPVSFPGQPGRSPATHRFGPGQNLPSPVAFLSVNAAQPAEGAVLPTSPNTRQPRPRAGNRDPRIRRSQAGRFPGSGLSLPLSERKLCSCPGHRGGRAHAQRRGLRRARARVLPGTSLRGPRAQPSRREPASPFEGAQRALAGERRGAERPLEAAPGPAPRAPPSGRGQRMRAARRSAGGESEATPQPRGARRPIHAGQRRRGHAAEPGRGGGLGLGGLRGFGSPAAGRRRRRRRGRRGRRGAAMAGSGARPGASSGRAGVPAGGASSWGAPGAGAGRLRPGRRACGRRAGGVRGGLRRAGPRVRGFLRLRPGARMCPGATAAPARSSSRPCAARIGRGPRPGRRLSPPARPGPARRAPRGRARVGGGGGGRRCPLLTGRRKVCGGPAGEPCGFPDRVRGLDRRLGLRLPAGPGRDGQARALLRGRKGRAAGVRRARGAVPSAALRAPAGSPPGRAPGLGGGGAGAAREAAPLVRASVASPSQGLSRVDPLSSEASDCFLDSPGPAVPRS